MGERRTELGFPVPVTSIKLRQPPGVKVAIPILWVKKSRLVAIKRLVNIRK